MSQLQTHDLIVLLSVENPDAGSWYVVPGMTVMHVDDRNSFGVCISRRTGVEGKHERCEVLWSKQPIDVLNVQTINANSRKLKAKWSAQSAEDINAFAELDKRVAEDIVYGRKTMEQVMLEDSDILDINMTQRIHDPNVCDIKIRRRSVELFERRTRDLEHEPFGCYDGSYNSRIRY